MENYFITKPFKERLKDTLYLLKHSFTVIKIDSDIKTPTINMMIYSLVMICLFFFGLLIILSQRYVEWGIIIILFSIFVLIPIKFFFNMRQKACQSWLVYNTVTGKDISYKQSFKHTSKQKKNLRTLAFIDMIMHYVEINKHSKNKGIAGLVSHFILSVFLEVWDFLNHYMIPAVVIEQKPLKDLIPDLKTMRRNVPAVLTGVFGIDFVGSHVLGRLLLPFYAIILIIAFVLGKLLVPVIPETVLNLGFFSISWIPIFIGLLILALIGSFLNTLIGSVKVIYFTLFYTSIMKPKGIIPKLKQDITHYLKFE